MTKKIRNNSCDYYSAITVRPDVKIIRGGTPIKKIQMQLLKFFGPNMSTLPNKLHLILIPHQRLLQYEVYCNMRKKTIEKNNLGNFYIKNYMQYK